MIQVFGFRSEKGWKILYFGLKFQNYRDLFPSPLHAVCVKEFLKLKEQSVEM